MPALLRTRHALVLAAVAASIAAVTASAQSPSDTARRGTESDARRPADSLPRPAALPVPTAPGPAPPSSSTYDVGPDGAVVPRNAPYPRNPRYVAFPKPPRMRMPAPLVLNPPGVVQAPVWSTARHLVASGRTAADEQEFAPDGECRWYRTSHRPGMATPQDAARQGIGSAELAALHADIEPVGAWLEAVPALSRPVGVCALFSNGGLQANPALPEMIDAGYALRGGAILGFWPPSQLRRRGSRVVPDGEIPLLIFDFNRLPAGETSRGIIEDAEGRMFEEVPVTHTVQGFPVLFNTELYIPRNERPLTRPARTDRLLRWQIGAIDADLVTRRNDAARAAEQLAALGSPAQRALDERTIQLRAQASYGGQVERARASFESERAAEAGRLRARADTGDPAHPVQELLRMRASTQRRLAALTPEAAAAQGCLSPEVAGTTVPDVLAVDDPHCVQRMEEPNPDYYDRTLPRSRVQLVRIRGFAMRRPMESRPATANVNLLTGVDWSAFRRDRLRP